MDLLLVAIVAAMALFTIFACALVIYYVGAP